MVIAKSRYYAHMTGTPPHLCDPIDNGNGPEITGPHAAAILAIADDDPGFVAWRHNKQWTEIKLLRDQQKTGGVFVSGKWLHTDTESRVQWLGLVMMGASVPPIHWKTMDGSFITLSQALVGSVFQAIASGDSADFANAETHRAAMMQSPTPESYDYSTGWRGVFQA